VTGALSGFIASAGVALVITSLTLPNRKSKEVIDSIGTAGTRLVEAVLGES
jgi:hypothetical protein